VEGDVMLQNGDCAEEFSVQALDDTIPGTVLVIDGAGCAVPCETAYDSRVLGVVSGAGGFKPAIVLDRQGGSNRRAVALMGKVFCLADAGFGAIQPGDVLTTSVTRGHAMRAEDRSNAVGAIIGKALGSLESGRGMIPILAILQ
jgi:hypothetical protein